MNCSRFSSPAGAAADFFGRNGLSFDRLGLRAALRHYAQGFLEREQIRRESAEIDLVTARHMFEQILDAQLQLRLANFFFPAEVAKIVQGITHPAQLSFLLRDDRQAGASFLPERRGILFRRLQLGGVLSDFGFGFLRFAGLAGEAALICRNIAAACRDKIGQLRFARGHRRAVVDQTFVPLPFRGDGQTQLIEFLRGFFLPGSRIFARLFRSGLAALFLLEILAVRFQFSFQLGDSFVRALHLLIERDLLAFQLRQFPFLRPQPRARRKGFQDQSAPISRARWRGRVALPPRQRWRTASSSFA